VTRVTNLPLAEPRADLPATLEGPVQQSLELSIAIMAHPRRAKFVEYLRERLGEVPVVLERGRGEWDTGERAWDEHSPDAAWHLVVQDDALLATDFLAAARRLLQHVPPGPVSFYLGRGTPYPHVMGRAVACARDAGAVGLRGRGPHWGVAFAVPVPMIEPMLRGARGIAHDNYDLKIERHFTRLGIACLYPLPSLANHRIGRDSPSMHTGRTNADGRVAWWWVDDGSALDVSYAGEYYDLGLIDSNQDPKRYRPRPMPAPTVVQPRRRRKVTRNAEPRVALQVGKPLPRAELRSGAEVLTYDDLSLAELRNVAQGQGIPTQGMTREQFIEVLSGC
jgi:hypothetical protein